MGLCYDRISIFLTYLLELVWHHSNLLILLFLPLKLQWYSIAYFMILNGFVKSLMLFNISLLRDQTFVLLLTKSISLWMLLQILIGLSSNTFCVIFGVWFLMAYISLIVTPLLCMILRMQTRLVVLLIASLWVVTLSFLVIYWFHRNQVSNARLLVLLPRPSIKP
jgi:hypothetical protein